MEPQPIATMAPFVVDATAYADAALPRSFPEVLIRRLEASNRAALAVHFLRLSRQDRRTRFGGVVSDEMIRRHCNDLDFENTICFAAFDAFGDVIGAALGFTCSTGGANPRQLVEIAVSVVPEYRRRGFGTDLVIRVCNTVMAQGTEAAVFEFDPSNAAICGLVRSLGGQAALLAESCMIPLSTLLGTAHALDQPRLERDEFRSDHIRPGQSSFGILLQ